MTLKALSLKEIKSNIKWTDDDTATLSEICQEKSSLQEKLEKSVGSVRDSQSSQLLESSDQYKKEFDYFDRHHVHGPFLTNFFSAILSAQPTSTQSERNFSLAASIITKKRSKLLSEKLNACFFLKSYFKNS